MAIDKAVGDTIGLADIVVQHKGDAITVWIGWVLWPGKEGSGGSGYGNEGVWIANQTINIPESPSNGETWQDIFPANMTGIFPDLPYHDGYEKADAYVVIREEDSSGDDLAWAYWEDVYELIISAPEADFRNFEVADYSRV